MTHPAQRELEKIQFFKLTGSKLLDPNPMSIYPCIRPRSLDEYVHHKGYIVFICVFFKIIPCIVVFFCYFYTFRELFIPNTVDTTPEGPGIQTSEEKRTKKQVLKFLMLPTTLFLICTLPFSIFFISLTAIDETTVDDNCERLLLVKLSGQKFMNQHFRI